MSICLALECGSAAGKRWARIPTRSSARAAGVFAFGHPTLRASTLSVNLTIGTNKPTRWCPYTRTLSGKALFLAPSRASSINTSSRPTRAKSSTKPIRTPLRPSAPGTASVLWTLDGYQWNDAAWLKRRAGHNHMSQPLNIYEVHIGSWKRHGDEPQGEPDEYGNYPGPMDPSLRSAASFTPMTTCRWSSWTTCAIWATRISRSCRLWSTPSMAPGVTRRPATLPPRRATATRSSSCTLSMRATRRASA